MAQIDPKILAILQKALVQPSQYNKFKGLSYSSFLNISASALNKLEVPDIQAWNILTENQEVKEKEAKQARFASSVFILEDICKEITLNYCIDTPEDLKSLLVTWAGGVDGDNVEIISNMSRKRGFTVRAIVEGHFNVDDTPLHVKLIRGWYQWINSLTVSPSIIEK